MKSHEITVKSPLSWLNPMKSPFLLGETMTPEGFKSPRVTATSPRARRPQGAPRRRSWAPLGGTTLGWWHDLNTLWWTNIGKIHYKWPFSIAMLVHQRVYGKVKYIDNERHIPYIEIFCSGLSYIVDHEYLGRFCKIYHVPNWYYEKYMSLGMILIDTGNGGIMKSKSHVPNHQPVSIINIYNMIYNNI